MTKVEALELIVAFHYWDCRNDEPREMNTKEAEAYVTLSHSLTELEKLKEQNKNYKAFFDELKLDTEVGDYDNNDYCSSYEILISNNVDVELNSSDEEIIKLYKEIIKDE